MRHGGIMIFALLALPLFGQDLKTVRRIHVGTMGQSDEAGRFRLLLEEQLGKEGFETTDNPENADATLTGVLAVRVYADASIARATVILKTRMAPAFGVAIFSLGVPLSLDGIL